ncbi:unnamed protein product, partial [Trypanosoma congolense IL3000]
MHPSLGRGNCNGRAHTAVLCPDESYGRANIAKSDSCQPAVMSPPQHGFSGNNGRRVTIGDDDEDPPSSQTSVNGFSYDSSLAGRATADSHIANEDNTSNVKVVVRVRPAIPREVESGGYVDVVRVSRDRRSLALCESLDPGYTDGNRSGYGEVYARQVFSFDYVHDRDDQQSDVYEHSARDAVLAVMKGYNATLMAYGQTGTGKTYTMEGSAGEGQHGIIARAVEEIFAIVNDNMRGGAQHRVRASYMQIYNEVLSDLLRQQEEPARPLVVRHTSRGGVQVEGLSLQDVSSPWDVYYLMERGTSIRATEMTRINELSSRSHAIFTLVVETVERDPVNGSVSLCRTGKLNIVDLAGSEKVHQSGARGQRLEETRNINRSLHELGNVISALAQRKNQGNSQKDGGMLRGAYVPFRNSMLTSVLRDSLGGNCKTTLIVCISPAFESYAESLSTLLFAKRAKNIRNNAVVNENVQRELFQLQPAQGAVKQQQGCDVGLFSELQQNVRRVEDERDSVMEALQRSLQAHKREQEVRIHLQHRLKDLEAMVQRYGEADGGSGAGGRQVTPEDYVAGLAEIHHEWRVLQEETMLKRYNDLGQKHKDIVVDLATKLSERDETIHALKEELESLRHFSAVSGDATSGELQPGVERPAHTAEPVKLSSTICSKEDAHMYLQSLRVLQPRADSGGTDVFYRSAVNPSTLLRAEEKILELLTISSTAAKDAAPPAAASHRLLSSVNVADGLVSELNDAVQCAVERIVHQEVGDRMMQLFHTMNSTRLQLLALRKDYTSLLKLMEAVKAEQMPEVRDAISCVRRYFDGQQETVRRAYEGSIRDLRRQLHQKQQSVEDLSIEIDVVRAESDRMKKCCVTDLQREEIEELCSALKHLQEPVA